MDRGGTHQPNRETRGIRMIAPQLHETTNDCEIPQRRSCNLEKITLARTGTLVKTRKKKLKSAPLRIGALYWRENGLKSVRLSRGQREIRSRMHPLSLTTTITAREGHGSLKFSDSKDRKKVTLIDH